MLAVAFAGPLHLALQPHGLCPWDGSLVHEHTDEDECAPIEGAGGEHPPTPHSHDAEGCGLALLLDAPGLDASATALKTPAAPTPADDALAHHARAFAPIAIIALAPSHSPPA